MKQLLGSLKNKTVLLVTSVAILAGGGTAAAIAVITIPDSSGVIHGCYDKGDGDLRVVKKDSECSKSFEKPLSWSQFGTPQHGVIAYAHVLQDGSLDVANSFNVSTSLRDPNSTNYCLVTNVIPKSVSVSPSSQSSVGSGVLIQALSVQDVGTISTSCAALPTANVAVNVSGEFFITFYN